MSANFLITDKSPDDVVDTSCVDIEYEEHDIEGEIVKINATERAELLFNTIYNGDIDIFASVLKIEDIDDVYFRYHCGSAYFVPQRYNITLLSYASSYRGYFKIVKFLLESGVDVDARDENGNTCLMLALRYAGCNMMRFTINYGTKIRIRPGRACLNIPSDYRYNTIKLLLQYNSQINIENNDGKSVIKYMHDSDCNKTRKLEEKYK